MVMATLALGMTLYWLNQGFLASPGPPRADLGVYRYYHHAFEQEISLPGQQTSAVRTVDGGPGSPP